MELKGNREYAAALDVLFMVMNPLHGVESYGGGLING